MDWLMGRSTKPRNSADQDKLIKGRKNEKKQIVEEKKPYLDPEVCSSHRAPEVVDLCKIIRKPCYVDHKEWFATHTTSLFHNVNHFYGTVSEFCTAESCPLMQGPCQMQYTWLEERGKKLKCTAPQYIDYVMTFCQKCVSNQELFPTKYAQDFSDNFLNEIKKMLRFLFHVISHLYYAHFVRVRQLDLHVYLNTIFKHFTYFVREFNLLDRRDTASLDDLVEVLGMYNTTDSTTEVQQSSSPHIPVVPAQKISSIRPQVHSYTRGIASSPTNLNTFQRWSTST